MLSSMISMVSFVRLWLLFDAFVDVLLCWVLGVAKMFLLNFRDHIGEKSSTKLKPRHKAVSCGYNIVEVVDLRTELV